MGLKSIHLLFAFVLASLLLVFSGPAQGATCTLCQIETGRAMGSLSLLGSQSSIILDRTTSRAIQNSATPLSFTLESWIYLQSTAALTDQPIFARYPRTAPIQGDAHAEFLLQMEGNGNVNLFFGGGSTNPNRVALEIDCGFNLINMNAWTHVALAVNTPTGRINPSEIKVYVNGQSVCAWTSAVGPAFDGTRRVMHDQPFAVGNYESLTRGCTDGALTMTAGKLDELRLWAGARSAEQILASYASAVDVTSPGLVGAFRFDRTDASEFPSEEGSPSTVVFDSSTTGANAAITNGAESVSQEISQAPIVSTVRVANYRLTPVALHAFAKDPADTWSVSLNVPADGVNMVYRDSLGRVPLVGSGIAVFPAPNARYPVVYFMSSSPMDTSFTISYSAVSTDSSGVARQFNTAQLTIEVVANGCDGFGGEVDRCNVCNGDGKCSPYGCDGQGNELDFCGDCNGNSTGCACSLSSWRNGTSAQLDEAIVHGNLAGLHHVIKYTEGVLDEVTRLLYSGKSLLCSEYTEVLAKIREMQSKTRQYNTGVLTPFVNSLN